MAVAVAVHNSTASPKTEVAGKEEARERTHSSPLLLPSHFLPALLPAAKPNLKPEAKNALDVFCGGSLPEKQQRRRGPR